MWNPVTLKVHEFFAKYANLPLIDRTKILNLNELGLTSMNDLYKEMQMIDESMRPLKIRQDEILKIAQEGFKALSYKKA